MNQASRALALLLILTGASLAWLPHSAVYAAEDRGWRLRVDFGVVETGADGTNVDVDGATARFHADRG